MGGAVREPRGGPRAAPAGHRSSACRFRRRSSMAASNGRQLHLRVRQALGRIVEIDEIRSQHRHTLRKVGMYPPQQLDKMLALFPREPCEGFGTDLIRKVENARKDRPRLVG